MASKPLVSIVAIGVAIGVAGAGAVIYQDEIQTALFDTDKFVACFKNEFIVGHQNEQALRGKTLGFTSVEVLLGRQSELLGYQIAKSVKRWGFNSMMEEAQSLSSEITSARLAAYQETGELQEKGIAAHVAYARVECLERQQLW